MWDPPGPGFEPISPALAGGFLTTVPPGKPKLLSIEDILKVEVEYAVKMNFFVVKLPHFSS